MLIALAGLLGVAMGCLIYFSMGTDRTLNWILIGTAVMFFVPIGKDIWLLANLHFGGIETLLDLQAAQLTEVDVWTRMAFHALAYFVGIFLGALLMKRSES